ncbi:MAG: transposase [Candidatus Bipolaricaulota bacterium]
MSFTPVREAATELKERVNQAVLSQLPPASHGAFSAMLIKAEIGTISRFPDADHLSSYCGLVPSTHSSGNYTHRGNITKEGNPWLRWVLTEAAGL